MGKDYLCKDCQYNKNGWCTKKSLQGLKNIASCEFKDGSIISDVANIIKDSGAYKQFGKREMFYQIQMQMIGIKEDDNIDKFETLMQVMVNLEKFLQIEEGIYGIALDYELDEDILNNSKAITKSWLKEVGEYHGR